MKRLYPIGILICMFLLTSCGSRNGKVLQVSNMILPKEAVVANVYLKEEVTFGKYEPEAGVYVGADVEYNIELEGKMTQYEEMVSKEQAFRVFQYKESGDITSKEILECIANKQIPYIKILGNEFYDLMPIYSMVGDLSTRYHTPLFIELFPVYNDEADPLLYAKYYEDAYKLIKKYIKDAVVVWSIDWNQIYDIPVYYPGNHLVDWVGLNVTLPKYKEGKVYEPAMEESIDFWYKNFQSEKPMLLSTLAISHFSRLDHTYTVEDAKNKLNYFYDTLPNRYPRIRGILYSNVDMYQVSKSGTEDYRVTSQEKLTTHIAQLQAKESFLSEIVREEKEMDLVPILYTVPAFKMNGGLYITEEQLAFIPLSKGDIRQIPCITDETMKIYYDLNSIALKQEGWVEQENHQK